jgi:hypothetical protein
MIPAYASHPPSGCESSTTRTPEKTPDVCARAICAVGTLLGSSDWVEERLLQPAREVHTHMPLGFEGPSCTTSGAAGSWIRDYW